MIALFDHSSGHCQKRPGSLNVASLNKGFGGRQPQMHSSNLFNSNDIGDFNNGPNTLKQGDTQEFQFPEHPESWSVGPWWFTDEEKEMYMNDVETGEWKTLKLEKNEMLQSLHTNVSAELLPTRFSDRNSVFLTALCMLHGLETTKQFNIVIPGWAGKAKGIAQILWERGKITGSTQAHFNAYNVSVTRDKETGEYKELTSLKKILGDCRDFHEERSMLEWVGSEIGLKVILTPKYHPELAGEGIEYLWGMIKSNYRAKPLLEKQGKRFESAVEASHSRSFVTLKRMRAAARKARSFIVSYMIITASKAEEKDGTPRCLQEMILNQDPVNLSKIYAMQANYKCHRNALDFAGGFVRVLGGGTD